MTNQSSFKKFSTLNENASAHKINTWIRAWEVRSRAGIAKVKDTLAYVDDNIL
ncbi:hypothetical protein H4R24_004652, partial [Coemansia sp. RSA 988]